MISYSFIFLFFPLILSTDFTNYWAFNREKVSDNAFIYIHSIEGHGDFNLMIQSQHQYHKYERFKCSGDIPTMKYISTYKINSSGFPQEFPIGGGGGNYYFSLFNCRQSFTIKSVRFSFLNSWGRLPFSKYPCMYISGIESAFYLVLFVLFLINFCTNLEIKTTLHILILATIGIYLLSCVSNAGLLISTNQKNSDFTSINQDSIYIVSSVFLCFRNFCLIMLTLFLASGLSIVYVQLETCVIFTIIIMSALCGTFGFLLDSDLLMYWPSFVTPFISIVFVFLFIITMIYLLKLFGQSLTTLSAHMELINSAGIDAKTTPTYRKKKLFRKLRLYSIILQTIFFVSLILYQNGAFWYFISYGIVAIANAILLGFICWKCRLRLKMVDTYADPEYSDSVINFGSDNEDPNGTNFEPNQNTYAINNDTNLNQDDQNEVQYPIPTYQQNNYNYNDFNNFNNNYNNNFNNDNNDNVVYPVVQNPYSCTVNYPNMKFSENVEASGLQPWEYGMTLPPMPQEPCNRNIIYPKD